MGLGGGGGSADPPEFIPLNVDELARTARESDIQRYGLSDADFARRYPQLVSGRQASINSAVTNLQGQHWDPILANALQRTGVHDVNVLDKRGIANKRDRDRTYFSRLLGANPQRAIGLSGEEVARGMVANTNNQNAYNMALWGGDVARTISQTQQGAQNNAALLSGIGDLAGTLGKSYTPPSTYLDPASYYTPPGGYSAQYGGNVNAPYGSTLAPIDGNTVMRATPTDAGGTVG